MNILALEVIFIQIVFAHSLVSPEENFYSSLSPANYLDNFWKPTGIKHPENSRAYRPPEPVFTKYASPKSYSSDSPHSPHREYKSKHSHEPRSLFIAVKPQHEYVSKLSSNYMMKDGQKYRPMVVKRIKMKRRKRLESSKNNHHDKEYGKKIPHKLHRKSNNLEDSYSVPKKIQSRGKIRYDRKKRRFKKHPVLQESYIPTKPVDTYTPVYQKKTVPRPIYTPVDDTSSYASHSSSPHKKKTVSYRDINPNRKRKKKYKKKIYMKSPKKNYGKSLHLNSYGSNPFHSSTRASFPAYLLEIPYEEEPSYQEHKKHKHSNDQIINKYSAPSNTLQYPSSPSGSSYDSYGTEDTYKAPQETSGYLPAQTFPHINDKIYQLPLSRSKASSTYTEPDEDEYLPVTKNKPNKKVYFPPASEYKSVFPSYEQAVAKSKKKKHIQRKRKNVKGSRNSYANHGKDLLTSSGTKTYETISYEGSSEIYTDKKSKNPSEIYTSFSCYDKPVGYYADQTTGCKVFHMCLYGGRRNSFDCPSGTLFHQQILTCDHWRNVDCKSASDFYKINSQLYEKNTEGYNELEEITNNIITGYTNPESIHPYDDVITVITSPVFRPSRSNWEDH